VNRLSARQQTQRGFNFVLRRFGAEVIPYRPATSSALSLHRALLPPERVRHIVDAGANIGQAARAYRACYPEATIHSFEPFSDTYAELRLYSEREDGSTIPINMGLAEQIGEAQLNVNSLSATNSFLPLSATKGDDFGVPTLRTTGTQIVKTTTLDDYATSHPLDTIDILKIDVQGFEGAVLRGSAGLLQRQAIELIYVELMFGTSYEGQDGWHDTARYIESHGYRLAGIHDIGYSPRHTANQADFTFLAVR